MSPTVIAVIGLGLSAIGTFQQFKAGKKAEKRAEESNRLRRQAEGEQKKLADLRTLRAKRAAAREAQIKREDIASAAVAQGGVGSSAVAGARGSLSTQLNANLSFLDSANKFQTSTTALLGRSQEIANIPTSTLGQSIAGFGGTIFDNSAKISNLFGKVTG